MVPGVLGLIVATLFTVVVAAPCVSRYLRRDRQVAGAAVVPPGRSQPSGGMAVPVITDVRDREERSAFAYDNGLAIERPEQDED